MRVFEVVLALWNLPLTQRAARLTGLGFNVTTLRELLSALQDADPRLALISVAWLVPWDRLALLAYHATKRLLRSAHAPVTA